jgi:tetratricopeptide (TPR) repeat protein
VLSEQVSNVDSAVLLAKQGRFAEALKVFDEGLCFALSPTAMSFYGLCLAAIEGSFDRAASFCLMAAERDERNPEAYLNLGRVFVMSRNRPYAIKAFTKGLKINPGHEGLSQALSSLGIRREPVIPFLPRAHFLNKAFGIMRHRIGMRVRAISLRRPAFDMN